MWNSGRTVRMTSSAVISNSRPGMSAFMYSWMWVSSAPFGLPVVPDVYMMTAVSLGSACDDRPAPAAGPPAARRTASRATLRQLADHVYLGHSGLGGPLAASSRPPAQVMSIRARQSARW